MMNEKIVRIDYTKNFIKQLKKAPLSIKISFKNRLSLFLQNSFHPLLNNHSLVGKYINYRSINITGDWRAIYLITLENKEKVVTFVAFGTHSQLYK